MSLFDKTRHKPCEMTPWSIDVARREIVRIVSDVENQFQGDALWLEHPLERDESTSTRLTSMYFGASGTVFALKNLANRNLVKLKHNYGDAIPKIVEVHNAEPDFAEYKRTGLLCGDLGVYFTAWLVTKDRTYLDLINRAGEDAITQPELDLMWGAAGTIAVAKYLFETTQEKRWKDLAELGAEFLWRNWEYDVELKCFLWTQHIYSLQLKFTGAVHGFAGNVASLAMIFDFLGQEKSIQLIRRTLETVKSTATVESETANWTASYPQRPNRPEMLIQYCHGAPGIILGMMNIPKNLDGDFEDLLLKGGELIWQAGPLAKPHGLCHGNAGNGYAFLALFKRTQDQKWLERARVFAMEAIMQSQVAADKYQRRRPSLWLGDMGLALYLADLVEGEFNGLPGFDYF